MKKLFIITVAFLLSMASLSQAQQWTSVRGSFKQISASSDGGVWGVNENDEIKVMMNNVVTGDYEWRQLDGSLKQISSGSSRHKWGVNSVDDIFRYGGYGWVPEPGKSSHGKLSQISVGTDGAVWGVNSINQIYRWTGDDWEYIPGELKEISVGSSNHIWGVNSFDQIYRWDGWGWEHMAGHLKQISVGEDGSVWGINRDGEIWMYNGVAWNRILGNIKYVAAVSIDEAWGIDSNDSIFKFNPYYEPAHISFSDGVLEINGSNSDDIITVEQEGSNAELSTKVTISNDLGINTQVFQNTSTSLTKIVAHLNDGYDLFNSATVAIPTTVNGGNGTDIMTTGDGNNDIYEYEQQRACVTADAYSNASQENAMAINMTSTDWNNNVLGTCRIEINGDGTFCCDLGYDFNSKGEGWLAEESWKLHFNVEGQNHMVRLKSMYLSSMTPNTSWAAKTGTWNNEHSNLEDHIGFSQGNKITLAILDLNYISFDPIYDIYDTFVANKNGSCPNGYVYSSNEVVPTNDDGRYPYVLRCN